MVDSVKGNHSSEMLTIPTGHNNSTTVTNSSTTNVKKPIKLRNVSTEAEVFDSLYVKPCNTEVVSADFMTAPKFNIQCSAKVCLGSLMNPHLKHSTVMRTPEDVLQQAKEFLDQYFQSIRRANSPTHHSRWEQVQREVKSTGTYQLTETELVYGAKLAWRNAARCIGRIQWSKLQVFDCRYVTTTSGMFEALCNHIKYSTNKGNIRSAITIFPQRSDGKHDFRIWNPQLISYAGYKQPDGTIVGDPVNAEFTEVCIKLGWRGAGTKFDILPLVLSANGHDPDYFDIPKELVLEVHLEHPTFKWFQELRLKWYALPAVSGMMFDCGGLEFTAVPFNGWYMSTEIGCRDLCDNLRYNMLETIALGMGLDIGSPVTLWKDKAMVECNIAVLYSFQKKGVTIVDHHTASDSFIKHLENETRLRNGCPADWVWIVPPLSGSATPVFHQEMALYYLKPSYEYQEAAWKCHVWKKGRDPIKNKKPRRKFHFKQIARAVKFTSKLFGRALSKRIKATIIYATETGKSENYAKKLKELFDHAFNAQVYCMLEYDISSIEHETLLLVVTSTFGNGDPPENGEEFARNLFQLKITEEGMVNGNLNLSMASSKSFIKANSQIDMASKTKLSKKESLKGSFNDPLSEEIFGPLSNVRFAVFALGSSAYPNFCAFGQFVDNLLGELGGERLLKIVCGDEMCGQEQAFKKWAPLAFKVSCETFCLDDNDALLQATMALEGDLSASCVRFIPSKSSSLEQSLSKCHNRTVSACRLLKRTNLHGKNSARSTLLLEIESDLSYKPGDHVGVFPANRQELVDIILKRLTGINDLEETVTLQILKESHSPNGIVKIWEPHERLPVCSVKELFTRYLDITTPPSANFLQYFASIATNENDQQRLTHLATDSAAYEDWRHWKFPNLAEVLEEFPSVKPYAPLLVAQMNVLQPRFYSISSGPSLYKGEIHLTVAVVTYKTQDGGGPIHYGVCSNYLSDVSVNDDICIFVRSAPNFYLPSDPTKSIIMVGPGTGIAPFRSFWQERYAQVKQLKQNGKMWLFFGCRQKELDLYSEEKEEMIRNGILEKSFLALSREPKIQKTYVQNLILKESANVYKMIVEQKGHFYVCGDVTMAEDVYHTLKTIIKIHGNMNEREGEKYMLLLKDENRYHEDIFGITLRTAEVHNKSRESARIRMASGP